MTPPRDHSILVGTFQLVYLGGLKGDHEPHRTPSGHLFSGFRYVILGFPMCLTLDSQLHIVTSSAMFLCHSSVACDVLFFFLFSFRPLAFLLMTSSWCLKCWNRLWSSAVRFRVNSRHYSWAHPILKALNLSNVDSCQFNILGGHMVTLKISEYGALRGVIGGSSMPAVSFVMIM